MSLVASQREAIHHRLASVYAPIAGALEAAEKLLRAELRSNVPLVDELARHAFRLGGKRLRPALLLLSALAVGDISAAHLTLAAVVEMIHTATLVHDDVLDEATLRRHLQTVNSRWNNKTSVLFGDYLFTHAFYLTSTLDSPLACQWIGRATNIVCEGELRQTQTAGRFDLTEEEYLSIVASKTAELCACCCRLGAYYAGAAENVVAGLERYGRNLGVAFQITDDLLDVWGDEEQAGKSLGTDLAQLKPTLPIIRLWQSLRGDDRRELQAVLTNGNGHAREIVLPWLERSTALAYTQAKAESYAAAARQELAALPAGAARDVLDQLTEFVLTRRE